MAFSEDAFNFGGGAVDLSAASDVEYSLRTVPTGLIDEHPDNRPVDSAHVAALADSIEESGLGQLPLVRVSPDDPARYQHIAGWHRIMAYRLLAERTGDSRWDSIRVAVAHGMSDARARELVYATNFTVLSTREKGEWFESIADEVAAARENGDGRFRGVRTAEAVAEIASERASVEITPGAVKHALTQARGKRPVGASDGSGKAVAALERAVSRVQELADGLTPVQLRTVRRCADELRRASRRTPGKE